MQVYDSNHSMPLASEVMITEEFFSHQRFFIILLPNFYINLASHKYPFYVKKMLFFGLFRAFQEVNRIFSCCPQTPVKWNLTSFSGHCQWLWSGFIADICIIFIYSLTQSPFSLAILYFHTSATCDVVLPVFRVHQWRPYGLEQFMLQWLLAIIYSQVQVQQEFSKVFIVYSFHLQNSILYLHENVHYRFWCRSRCVIIAAT